VPTSLSITNREKVDRFMPILEVKGLTKDFKGLRAVNRVNFTIEKNEIYGMIGPNGSGKSTIFNMISGLYIPTEGSIRFKEEDVTGLHPHVVCDRGVGRTFQITKPFLNLTVMENVIIGALNRTNSVPEARKKAMDVLTQMELAKLAEMQGKNLTAPQRKRLELARALATEPELLLLDEVMAGLNPTEVKQILEVLNRINENGLTIFLVEHIMHAIMSISHRVMVLHHGQTIAVGVPKEIAGDEKVIEAYLGEEYSIA
jgi:branched-chain amino acid transport system ATP-binding protein